MITILLINFIVALLGIIFTLFPVVTSLPTIFGFDIDGFLVTAMGTFNKIATLIWPLYYLMQGFLVLLGYFTMKAIIKLFLGSRVPTA